VFHLTVWQVHPARYLFESGPASRSWIRRAVAGIGLSYACVAVFGDVLESHFREHGNCTTLGYPTRNEKDIAGGKKSDFTGSNITWVDGNTTVAAKS
jgi:hypothetical protein